MLASPVPSRDTIAQRPPEDEAPVRVVVRSRPLNAIEKSDGCRCVILRAPHQPQLTPRQILPAVSRRERHIARKRQSLHVRQCVR